MTGTKQYDYIIAGAGCAGLSLAVHMIRSGKFSKKKILIVDKEEKKKNDRTWCFWETKPGLFEPVVYHRWNEVWFHEQKKSKRLSLSPYQYKLVRGIDFYNYSFDLIKKHPYIDFRFGEVSQIKSDGDDAFLILNNEKYAAQYIFNSILFQKPVLKKKEYYLLQHFKGWVIETEKPVFNPGQAVLMDFRVSQQYGTTFIYVMPFSATKALVEYTLFTEHLLKPEEYSKGLREYIQKYFNDPAYKIIEEEFGVIPMTNHRFPLNNGNIINIGSAGGQTKASSGYTFRFIQKQAGKIVDCLADNRSPGSIRYSSKRFHFYDSVLLEILYNNRLPGSEIFSDLFRKNKPKQVLKFLDNETTIFEELPILLSLPVIPFLKAALRRRF